MTSFPQPSKGTRQLIDGESASIICSQSLECHLGCCLWMRHSTKEVKKRYGKEIITVASSLSLTLPPARALVFKISFNYNVQKHNAKLKFCSDVFRLVVVGKDFIHRLKCENQFGQHNARSHHDQATKAIFE